ncbi:hypothetical protein WMY93_010530 [Mugilogobius chulae]|uniref:Protoheme IX farnesyltransferase, mitochondrial n=1 Tax=Mugilogobius chulae TaxID=88201 RepID=A0AAW0PDB2_9GOBI
MYKSPCSRLSGLVGASLKQRLLQNVPRCNHSTRSIIKLYRRDPSDWLTYQHLNFLKRQYVTKNRSGLHQRAFPKQQPVVTVLEEAEDAVERQVQRIPTIGPEQEELSGEAKPKVSKVDPSTKDVSASEAKATEMGTSEEAPHIQEETELAKVARLDRQWKELKVETSDLPDVYARLAKIKLTALVVMTAAAGYAMAPVPFDPLTFFIASLGTGLASSAANSINQDPASVSITVLNDVGGACPVCGPGVLAVWAGVLVLGPALPFGSFVSRVSVIVLQVTPTGQSHVRFRGPSRSIISCNQSPGPFGQNLCSKMMKRFHTERLG